MDYVVFDNFPSSVGSVCEKFENQLFSFLRLHGDEALDGIRQDLQNGASLEEFYCGATFLGAACWAGRCDVVQLVIDFLREEIQMDMESCKSSGPSKQMRKKSPLDIYDSMGNTPLILAIITDHFEICQLLLENGADINRPHQSSKQTPLLIAIEENKDRIGSFLIGWGADIQQCDNVGITPLYAALRADNEPIVSQLIEEGCDVNIGSQDHSPIFLAVRRGQLNMVKMLCAAGCDKDIRNKYGVTPIMEAALKGQTACLQYLLEAKCNPNLVDMYNRTCLIMAVRGGHLDCVKLLIEGGVNWKMRDLTSGDTAVDLALLFGRSDILEYFLCKGIEVTLKRDGCGVLKFNMEGVSRHVHVDDGKPTPPNQRIKYLMHVIEHHDISTIRLLIRNCPNLPLLYCHGAVQFLMANEDLLRMFLLSGAQAVPWQLLKEEVVPDWLKEFHNNPRSLKQMCRISVRQSLGNRVLADVCHLHLPSEVKEYITLSYL